MIKSIVLVAIMISILLLLYLLILYLLTPEYDKCYSEMEREGYAAMGCCGGVVGGTSATEYLSENCIGCPHLVLGCNPKDGKENGND